jgi:hypothetical protein
MEKPPKKTWVSPKIEIRETLDKGKGMFASENIFCGEELLVWGGEYTDIQGVSEAKKEGKLCMQWDENLFSIETRGEDVGYFINHSCNSNTWMIDAYTLTARKDIRVGEEVTADYSLWEADENYVSKWQCKCGCLDCRKRVTGKDWRNLVLQRRYKDHFSPLINKRIANLSEKLF